MFRLGRTLFFSILLPLLSTQSHALDSSYHHCLKNVLEGVANHPRFQFAEAVEHYNHLIQKPARSLSNTELSHSFKKALDHLHPMNPSFPKDEFLAWFQKNPLTDAELAAVKAENKTLGDVLHSRAMAFEKAKESVHFEKATQELNEHLSELRKACGEDVTCHEKSVARFVKTNEKKLFPCLRQDRDTLRSVIAGFAVANAGMTISHFTQKKDLEKNQDPSVRNYPYDAFLNSVLWTPIMGEIACKNKARASADLVGQVANSAPKKRSFLTKAKIAGQAYWSYMKWSPLNEATYMSFHLADEKFIRDHDVDLDPSKLGKQFVMYMKWDAVYAVPRSVLISDPFFNRTLPERFKPVVDRLIQNKIASETAYTIVDGGLKVGQSYINRNLFTRFENTGSFAFVLDWLKLSGTQPAAPPVRTSAASVSCETLRSHYESCINRYLDQHSDFELEATSNHGTPTCEACLNDLNAYEASCGSYWGIE